MKNLTLILALFLPAMARGQLTTITASNIANVGGQKLATGQWCATPAQQFVAGGGGNIGTQQVCYPITNGALPAGVTLYDTSLTNPVNVCYIVTVHNSFGQSVGSYPCMQPSGSTYSFDAFVQASPPYINTSFTVPQFLTNGVVNGIQNSLNIAGGGVTYSSGTVTISASAGVSSINTVQGAFTFTGSGVSCSTTTCTFSGGGIPYPGAGVPLSTGTAWGTSYQVGTAANDLVQLNSSGYLPALNASLLTAYPYASLTGTPTIPTVGTWGALNYPAWVSGTPFVKMTAAGTFSLDTNTYLTGITSSQVTTALGFTPYNATNPAAYITNTIVTLPDLSLPYTQLSGAPTIPTSADWPGAGACTTNEWVTALVNGAVSTCLQPAFSNLSGQAALTQLPTLTANSVLGALTATTPSALALPSCSGSTNALIWTSGTGFGCNTISTSGLGTVTSVAMTVPSDETVAGSPITTNGTLAVTRNSEAANLFLASPSGAAGVPAYRAIVAADVPTLNQSTTGNAATATSATTATNLAGGALGSVPYQTAASTTGLLASPTVNGNYVLNYNVTAGAAVAPTATLAGLTTRLVSGTTATDTILYSDNDTQVEYDTSVAVAVTLPTATTLGNPHFYSLLNNFTTGTGEVVTVTPTTWTVNGATSFAIQPGQGCSLSVDPASTTNWLMNCGPANTPAVANEFVTAYSPASGQFTLAQPSFSNLSGTATAAQIPASLSSTTSVNGTSIPASATLMTTTTAVTASQLPAPTATTLGGIESAAAVANEWVSSISTAGVPALTQPAFANLSGTATQAQLPATSAVVSSVQQATYTYAADTGTANAYAVAQTPAPTIVAGSIVRFKALNANTGAATLAVNGGTAVALDTQAKAALPNGAIQAGGLYEAEYDGTEYQLLTSSASGGSAAGAIIQNPTATATNTVAPTATSVVPLTLNAPSGGTTDVLDVENNGTKNFYVDSNGFVHAGGTYLFAQTILSNSDTSLTLNAGGVGEYGRLVVFENYNGATVTAGDAVAYNATGDTVTNCGLSCTNAVGVWSGDQVQTRGNLSVNLDGTYTLTAGERLCTSAVTAGEFTPVAGPCPVGTRIGFVDQNATSATTASAYLKFGGSGLTGTTATITGTALSSSCDSGTATVTGAIVGTPVSVSSTTGVDVGGAFYLRASVTAANTVTVYICGTGTPASLAYNVKVE
ncbi:MAG: beta strand repeat-containing protein [Sulfobacillus sp.]